MNLFLFICVFCVASSRAFLRQSTPESDFYNAAVVEFHRSQKNVFDAVSENLEAYSNFIEEAKQQSADIVIFPEATLNSYDELDAIQVPHGSDHINPCDNNGNYSKILINLSCAAKVEKIYLVINVAEKAPCNGSECPHPDYYLFNTNVVFDRNGTIISRYRKINLFGEDGFSPSVDRELGVFDTDFGVRFGHFICFDLMFQDPALTVIVKENVTDIIFPTMWFSELPFLTAVQIQEGYAYANNVNFLAAGANNPDVGNSGTGIYSGKQGRLTATMNGEPTSKMLVSKVFKDPETPLPGAPKKSNRVRDNQRENNPATVMDSLFLKQDNLMVYNTELLKIVEEQQVNLTYEGVECQFDVKMNLGLTNLREEIDDEYLYRAVAFHGVKLFDVTTGGVTSCAVVACTNDTIASCGQRFPNHENVKQSYEISSIVLKASVPYPKFNESTVAYDRVYYPVTLDNTVMPLGVNKYQFVSKEIGNHTTNQILIMDLPNGHYSNLLTFGFFGRAFEKDGHEATGGSTSEYSSWIIICLATLFSISILFSNRI